MTHLQSYEAGELIKLNGFVSNVSEPNQYYEKDLLNQWFQLPIGTTFDTREGRTLTIIHHGTRNRNKGPDINNAILLSVKYSRGRYRMSHFGAGLVYPSP